ncbi:TonB-dependent receptor [Gaoshiqia sp. Z1-71]|uniref:TonB-dependent receptor n=1 Tax=Gaoshiqia hydrogeniformans TaxID=3290090 RepID=UPI003BF8D9FC
MKKSELTFLIERRLKQKLLLKMKLTLVALLVCMMQVSASVYSQTTKFTFDFQGKKISDVLKDIEETTNFRFFYQREQVDVERKVNLQITNKSVEDVLTALFRDAGVSYRFLEDNLILLTSDQRVFQQQSTVKGRVSDSNNQPLPGVTVLVKGTASGTITDIDGYYSISNVPANGVLVFSFVGMRTQELPVSGRLTVDVALYEETIGIDEVVAIGYGVQKKSDATGSISVATADDILRAAPFNALAGLKGKVSGVNIFTNSGQPGGATRVMIRGIGTINSSSNPLYVVDGVVMEDFQFLNPNDVERIDVLKDASATAIYGARGANGVIMVTTKRGLAGEGISVTYNGYVSMSHKASKMDVLNAAEFMEAMEVSFENNRKWYGGTSTFNVSDPKLFDSSGNPLYDTDWQDEATRTAYSHSHQLSIQQGGKSSSVGAFINYTDYQGVMLNTYMKRVNTKLSYDANPLKWLSTGINLLVNHTWQNDTDEGGGSQVARRTMIEMPAIFPVKWTDGSWVNSQSTNDFSFEAMANPVHLLKTQERMRYRTQIFGNAALTFHLLPGLDLRTQFGVDAHLRKWREYSPNDLINISSPNGYAFMSDTQQFYWQEETYLTYNKVFGKHRLNTVAGLSWQERTYNYMSVSATGFKDNFYGYNNLGAATNPGAPSSTYNRWAMNSYFVRGAYTYNDKYMATATARIDGSSKFGKNNKYAFFPSVGLGWLISNEDFMADVKAINQLKLHASYGVTGNSEIAAYRSLATITSGTYLIDGSRQAISYASRLSNPDLKWEKTNQFDIGVNLDMFGNRLSFDASWYYKLTTDLLLDSPVPHSTGFSSVIDNIGEVANYGVDFMMNSVNVKTKDFSWNSTVNLNFNKNEIKQLGENDEDILPGPNWVSGSQTILRVGESLSSFWGYERLGVWTEEERAEAEAAGARVGQAKRSAAKKILGKGIPDLTGSFINTFNYKNFDFTVDLQFVTGVEILQQFYHSAEDRFGYTSGLASILYDGYNGTNPNTMVQAVRNANLSGQSSEVDSRWVCDGSYLRGNLIQLGYSVDTKSMRGMKLAALRVYASVNNAFVLHSKDFQGYDPEGTSQGDNQWGQNMFFYQYPKPRTYTLGVNVTF